MSPERVKAAMEEAIAGLPADQRGKIVTHGTLMIGLNLLCEHLLEQLVTVVHEHQQETKELRARIVALEQRPLEAAAE